MPASRVQGLAETYALFDTLPNSARDQMGVELALIGRDFLALQQVRVPVDTGALESGLGVQVMLDRLRVRIGLLGLSGGRSKFFYGRIVDAGRSAQTVLVQRRRRVNGKLRTARNRKRVEDMVATYSLKVKARDAVPFVGATDADIDSIATRRLADFWAGLFDKAPA